MKTRVLSMILILLMCLTTGCGKASQSITTPDELSFSESRTEEAPDKLFDATITADGNGIVYTTDKADLGAGSTWFDLKKVGDNKYEVIETH